jgi:hypothetical protein
MDIRTTKASVLVLLAITTLVSTVACASSESASAADTSEGDVRRTAAGNPDLNGFWFVPRGPGLPNYGEETVPGQPGAGSMIRTPDGSFIYEHVSSYGEGESAPAAPENPEATLLPPYKPEYMTKVEATVENALDNLNIMDPVLDCKPMGTPRASVRGGVGGMQIVQNEDYVVLLYEDAPGPYYRIIYTDGRAHPEDVDASFFGHSVGKWEGDTLVVDVVGLTDETMLMDPGRSGPTMGKLFMHSDQMRITERWTPKGNMLYYDAVVNDPVMFSKPWVMQTQVTQRAAKGDRIMPQTCVGLDKAHIARQIELNRKQKG